MILTPTETAIMLSAAMMLGAAGMLVCARLAFARGNLPAPSKTSIRAAVVQQKARPKKRVMAPAFVAHYVLDNLRYDDSEDHPLLPGDLDDFIDQWCDDNGVERVAKATVREIIAQKTSMVTKVRTRLNMDNPAHRWVRQRQIARGEPLNDRPTIYIMANTPATEEACPAPVRAEANACPSPARAGRTRVRTADGPMSGRVSQPERRVA